MIFSLLAIFFFMMSSLFAETVCLNMIVKNEKDVITRCLSSVLPLIDSWVIVDTGSTDGTQEIIKEFLKDVPGVLYERPWVNFGFNRNEALALAKEKADYILLIDADDKLVFPSNFKMPSLGEDFYVFPTYVEELKCFLPRLIKSSLNWHWDGVIHEEIRTDALIHGGLLKEIEYIYQHDGARSKDPNTYKKDLALLLNAVQEDPQNARNLFFLGMTYLRLGQLEQALDIHEKRSLMKGLEEETFLSKLMVGEI